ncbi:PEP/pyruvate-binding domain-containing protein [Pseudomonas sp. RIT-PI-AD]|uniref:PEP/pyruvate-binding domain-containing protein n=1 Tax=Pseudomonas sp. RIT-PI-AD TaxID=3035294 RepID=UPI0021DB0F29|nr:PEP/pyruvate-binding domain-containing protein [Pseudomonas sp. RIT-PI-AD]
MSLLIEPRDLLDPGQVGFKFSRQAQMREAGFPVPPFCCVPASAFDRALAPLRADSPEPGSPHCADRRALRAWAAGIRQRLSAAPLDQALAAALHQAFDRLAGPDGFVAVRACVVTGADGVGEDSAQDPFAGLSDSFLYVRRAALLKRVAQCWASAFNEEAVLYRLEQGLAPFAARVAVGIQTMVCGTRSFVAFSVDPRDAANRCVIAAAHGIGEGVVQDKADVDHFFYARGSGAVTSTLIAKHRQAVRDPALDDDSAEGFASDGVVVREVPAERVAAAVLDDGEVRAIAHLALRVEAYFGMPQDIEGTLTEDGVIHLVQARPIAVDPRLRHLWSNSNITESFPGVTTALTYSFAQAFYYSIFRDLYRRLGVSEGLLRRNATHLQQMIGFLHGRIYYRLDDWYILHSQLPVFPLFRPGWERMMGIEPGAMDGRSALPPLGRWRAALRLGASAARVIVALVRNERRMGDFEAWWERLFAARRGQDLGRTTPLARIEDFHGLWREVSEWWGLTLINDTLLSNASGLVGKLLARYLPDADPALFNDLLCGDEENRSSAILMSLVALGEQVRAHPTLSRRQEDEQDLWPALERGEFGEPLLQAFRRHLHHYGDRGLQELKMEQPSLRDTPATLLRLARHYADAGLSVDGLRRQEQGIRQAAERVLEQGLGQASWRFKLLAWLVGKVRLYARYRENSRYCRSELFGYARALFQSLGKDLARQGVLRSADDVFHLTREELFGYFEGTGSTPALQGLADTRRAAFERPGEELPMAFSTYEAVPAGLQVAREETAAVASEDGAMRGLGSSSGVVRGIARVVLDPQQAIASTEDMILVARETDPGWLFLMLTAKGIVVERGTMLSHTAITSRKFGIPSVVSLANATRLIPDGALIEINGTSGAVTLLEQEEVA